MQPRVLLLAVLGVGDAQPAGMARAREGHVRRRRSSRRSRSACAAASSVGCRSMLASPSSSCSTKRSPRRVSRMAHTNGSNTTANFSPFDLWTVTTFHQRGFALQPHDLLVAGSGLRIAGPARSGRPNGGPARVRRPTPWRPAAAVRPGAALGLVSTLAAGAGKQARGQVELVQQLVQHRQHAVPEPAVVQLAEALAAVFPVALVLVEAIEFGVIQAQRGGGPAPRAVEPGSAQACSQRSRSAPPPVRREQGRDRTDTRWPARVPAAPGA